MTAPAATFLLIDPAAFYSDHYPGVSRGLATFAGMTTQLVRNPDDADNRRVLAASARDIIMHAYDVCSIPRSVAGDDNNDQLAIINAVSAFIAVSRQSDVSLARQCAAELTIHFDYVVGKLYPEADPQQLAGQENAGTDLASPTTAAESRAGARPPRTEDFPYFRDFIIAIIALLCRYVFGRYRWKSADPRHATTFFDVAAAEARIPERAKTIMAKSTATLQGWCSPAKATMLFSLVRDLKPKTAVEIGIYGGRSIVPIALALQENRQGSVTGIETWSAVASTKFRTSIDNDFHWSITDYSIIKRNFFRFALEHELFDVIKVIEASSDRANVLLDEIDFIHIDGGHSAFGAALDVVTYVSKVRTGGIVVFDDIDWETTAPGVEVLRDSCQLIDVVPSSGQATVPGCAAFRKL